MRPFLLPPPRQTMSIPRQNVLVALFEEPIIKISNGYVRQSEAGNSDAETFMPGTVRSLNRLGILVFHRYGHLARL